MSCYQSNDCQCNVGIYVFSCVVDIPSIHASDDVSAVERNWPQLLSWCRPYPHSTTTAVWYWTLACQTLVHIATCVLCICVYACMCVCMYVCMYVCVCVCVCVFIYLCTSMCAHAYIYMCVCSVYALELCTCKYFITG